MTTTPLNADMPNDNHLSLASAAAVAIIIDRLCRTIDNHIDDNPGISRVAREMADFTIELTANELRLLVTQELDEVARNMLNTAQENLDTARARLGNTTNPGHPPKTPQGQPLFTWLPSNPKSPARWNSTPTSCAATATPRQKWPMPILRSRSTNTSSFSSKPSNKTSPLCRTPTNTPPSNSPPKPHQLPSKQCNACAPSGANSLR